MITGLCNYRVYRGNWRPRVPDGVLVVVWGYQNPLVARASGESPHPLIRKRALRDTAIPNMLYGIFRNKGILGLLGTFAQTKQSKPENYT